MTFSANESPHHFVLPLFSFICIIREALLRIPASNSNFFVALKVSSLHFCDRVECVIIFESFRNRQSLIRMVIYKSYPCFISIYLLIYPPPACNILGRHRVVCSKNAAKNTCCRGTDFVLNQQLYPETEQSIIILHHSISLPAKKKTSKSGQIK